MDVVVIGGCLAFSVVSFSGASFFSLGGGLAGLSAAHTALQAGLTVTMIERNAFMG
jgi:heterodisulfide reductase subunit A-like polyferredoxin